MGEHIKDLGIFKFNNRKINIELNHGSLNNSGNDIHIEAPPLRFEMSDYEFIKMMSCFIEAKNKIYYKKEKEKE